MQTGRDYKLNIATLITIVTTNTTYPKYCNKNNLCVSSLKSQKGCCSACNKFPFLKNQRRKTQESDSGRKNSRWTPSRCSLPRLKRANNYDCTDQAGSPVWCRTDYRTVWPTLETRLADWVECPRQNNKRSFWMNRRDSLSSSFSNVLPLLFCVFSTWIWFYEEFVRKKTVLDTNAVKSVYVE